MVPELGAFKVRIIVKTMARVDSSNGVMFYHSHSKILNSPIVHGITSLEMCQALLQWSYVLSFPLKDIEFTNCAWDYIS
jgi:hypothetical protein